MKKTFLKEEMNKSFFFFFLMELKGNARCGAECQLDPVLGSPLKGSHITYVNHWEIDGHAHIYTNTSTHRTQWIKYDFQVLHVHIHADSQQWHTQCSICQPGLTSQVEQPKHTHKYCIHLHTVTHTHTRTHSWQPQQPRGNQHYLGLKQRGQSFDVMCMFSHPS